MEINGFSKIKYNDNVKNIKCRDVKEKTETSAVDTKNEQTSEIVKQEDTFVKEESQAVSSETGIYSKESIQKTVEDMEEQRMQRLTDMVTELLGEQAKAKGLKFVGVKIEGLEQSDEPYVPTQEDIDEAKASIEEGGFWSVDKVAGRIMEMAELLAGGDASKLDTLKQAVIDGFGGAASALGKSCLDEMPDITRQTYDEVMNRFDELKNKLSGGTDNIDE